jgi:hypothetical protein
MSHSWRCQELSPLLQQRCDGEGEIHAPSHTSGCVCAGLQPQGMLRKEDIRTHCRWKAQERHELVLEDCDILRCGEGYQLSDACEDR